MSQPDAAQPWNEAARLLTRATDDRDLRTRLRAQYHGRHDVLDALWWRAHPLCPAPSGRADPAAALDPLRRAAYARSADASTQRALREAMLELDADAVELDRLLAMTWESAAPVAQDDPTVLATPPRPLRRRLVLTLAAVLVVAAAAFSLGRLADRPATSAAGASSASPSPYDGGSQRGSATLALLESAQVPRDIPPFALGTDTISSSVHLIFDGYSPGVVVYGALGHRDTVCMVVIVAQQESSQTCSTTDRFIDAGLHLRVTTSGRIVNDSGFLVPRYYEFSWQGDGSVSATSNAYPYPAPPRR